MAGVLPNDLRSSVTELVGRRAELTQLAGLLARHRLATITGPGGIGKTRLAAELSERVAGSPVDPPGGVDEVRWLDLEAVADRSELVHGIVRELGVRPPTDGRDPFAAVATRLRRRRPMLVLDTCELLLGDVADVVERLLRSCAAVSVLVTSRERLGIVGEAVWRAPALTADDGASLFVERARSVTQDPGLTATDPTVRAICDRLDGLPLAIELASAWTRVFTTTQILAGLDERFRLLTGGQRRGTPRHRTLDASMTWSHDLLTSSERIVIRRVSMLVGSFGPAAADELVGPLPDAADPVEVLARLVDKSLLETERVGAERRYRMSSTVREYASERLADAAEADEVRERHLDRCLRTMHAVDALLGRDQDAALRLFEEIEADAVSAIDRALRRDGATRRRGRALAHLMATPWFLRSEGRRSRLVLGRAAGAGGDRDDRMDRLLAADVALVGVVSGRFGLASPPDAEPSATTSRRRAAARSALAHAYETFFLDLAGSREEALAAAARAHEVGDPVVRDFALVVAAYTHAARDEHDAAKRLVGPVADRAHERGDRFCASWALGVEQYAALRTGRVGEAVRLGREMVASIEPLGDSFGLGFLTEHLALALCLAGELDEARAVLEPIVGLADASDEIDVIALPVPMGHICLRAGDWDGAARWFGRGLLGLEHGRPDWTVARCLPGAVEALRRLGRTVDAAELVRRGSALGVETPDFLANLTEQRARLVPDDDPLAAVLQRRALGIRIRAGIRTELADDLDGVAARRERDRPAEAVRLLAAGAAAREAMGYPRAIGERAEAESLLARLRVTLGPAVFDEAWRSGRGLGLDRACELAQAGRRRPARPDAGWAGLTPTELAVVRLIAEGATNAEVARQMVVSRATVKTHLYHVFTKLDVGNRTELAAIAHARQPGRAVADGPT